MEKGEEGESKSMRGRWRRGRAEQVVRQLKVIEREREQQLGEPEGGKGG